VQVKSTYRYRKGGYLVGACHFSAGGTKQAYAPEQIDDSSIFARPGISCTAWKRPCEDGGFAGEGARATWILMAADRSILTPERAKSARAGDPDPRHTRQRLAC